MFRITIISTGQPSANPRLVKEANALANAGHDVSVLYCHWINWADACDEVLLKTVKWKYQLVGGNLRSNRVTYMYSRFRWKVNRILNRYFGNRLFFGERSQARCYDELLKAAKATKGDWYIGHNLGSLAVAVKAAQHCKSKCGFDFEDYHREEVQQMSAYDRARINYLENRYTARLDYISSASPMIAEKVEKDLALTHRKVFPILNCFPLSEQPEFREGVAEKNGLQLFWFSQTIGMNRGLEIILEALEQMKDDSIHLTLAGRVAEDMLAFIEEKGKDLKANIHLAGIIQPSDLPAFAGQFDVGLAIETDVPINRNICLTNKIFTYLLAGNAIIFSKTAAQKEFNDTYQCGLSFEINNVDQLMETVRYYKAPGNLEHQRRHNFELATNTLNWENESKKLLAIIN